MKTNVMIALAAISLSLAACSNTNNPAHRAPAKEVSKVTAAQDVNKKAVVKQEAAKPAQESLKKAPLHKTPVVSKKTYIE